MCMGRSPCSSPHLVQELIIGVEGMRMGHHAAFGDRQVRQARHSARQGWYGWLHQSDALAEFIILLPVPEVGLGP